MSLSLLLSSSLPLHGLTDHITDEIEAHGNPPSTHRVFQELVETAKKSMNNATLKHFKANSYKKVLALNLQQRASSSTRAKRRLDNAREAETAKHAQLVVTGKFLLLAWSLSSSTSPCQQATDYWIFVVVLLFLFYSFFYTVLVDILHISFRSSHFFLSILKVEDL